MGSKLALTEIGNKLSLEIQEQGLVEKQKEKVLPEKRIEQALSTSSPLALSALREACGIKMETLCRTLKVLIDEGRVSRNNDGYRITSP